jgi:hypothetical protein
MQELRTHLQNALNVTYVGSVMIGYINDAIATRKERQDV